ncbi:MAG: O-antigen ligase family protein [Candidatus Hodarchaeota archaeon]
MNINLNKDNAKPDIAFFLVLAFLILEYVRPQDLIPVLGNLRPGVFLTLLLAIFWFFAYDKSSLKENQTIFFILMLILMTIYIPFAHNNFFAYITTKYMWLKLPFFLGIIAFVNSRKKLDIYITLWMIIGYYIIIKGTLGKGIGGSSFLDDENEFCLFVNMLLPFFYFFLIYERKLKGKLFYLIGIILSVVAIITSFSRGGFIGFLSVCLIICLKTSKKILFFSIIILISSVFFFFSNQSYFKEIGTIKNINEGTALTRIQLWKAAWKMWKDNPFGVGPNNFTCCVHKYQPKEMKRSMWGVQTHSLYFTLLADLGIFGVFLWFSILYYNIKDIIKLKNLKEHPDTEIRKYYYLSLAYLVSLVGYLSSGMFVSVLYYSHFYCLTAIIMATRRVIYDLALQQHLICRFSKIKDSKICQNKSNLMG